MKLVQHSFSHRTNSRWRFAVLASLCGLFVGVAPAQAQSGMDPQNDPQVQGERADPPGRIGRLSDLNGQVWLFSPDSGDWVAASRNQPLTSGDRLSTDAGARAEVRIGSTTLRLDSGSELEVLRLDDDRVALQLHNGSVSARLRNREAAAEFELKTGEGRFKLLRTGRYRFDRIDEASHVTVYNGQALYEGPGSALTVNSGQRAEFWIDASNTAQYSITEPLRDAFSAWNSERDRGDDRSASTRYVSPEMTGVEDLDRHGRWEQSDEYGALWYPRVVVSGWAPYSTGHWAWVRPWGWTWIDDAPWGFAPFHYGRWVWFHDAWGWAPGTYVARPVYAPALVAWVGGPRLSVSINIGAAPAVGWFPLAPREIYVPSYRVTPRYVQNINITHVTRIVNVNEVINHPQPDRDYANRKFPHAVTVVPASVMTGHEQVGPAVRQRDFAGAREIAEQPGRHAALIAPPVAAPAPPVRSADGPPAPPNRPQRPREREVGDAPRQPAAEPGNPAQPVPARSRVQPNPPVAPRTDVAPLQGRPAPASPQEPMHTRPAPRDGSQARPPQAAQPAPNLGQAQRPPQAAQPSQPAPPAQQPPEPPRVRVRPPHQAEPQPEAAPRNRGEREVDPELLRKRAHGERDQGNRQ